MTRHERSGWRCEWISRRHRRWGADCPGVDVDFLVAEYDAAKPVAIVEYKHINASPVFPTDPSIRTLADLANQYRPGPLPFLVVRYDPDWSCFMMMAGNNAARVKLRGHLDHWISEKAFVTQLQALRFGTVSFRDRHIVDALPDFVPEHLAKRHRRSG